MRYIKNLINNILYLLKHDILVNNMIKERRIQKNRDDLINIQNDIEQLKEYVDDKNLYLFNLIDTMSNKRVSNKGGK